MDSLTRVEDLRNTCPGPPAVVYELGASRKLRHSSRSDPSCNMEKVPSSTKLRIVCLDPAASTTSNLECITRQLMVELVGRRRCNRSRLCRGFAVLAGLTTKELASWNDFRGCSRRPQHPDHIAWFDACPVMRRSLWIASRLGRSIANYLFLRSSSGAALPVSVFSSKSSSLRISCG